MAEQAQLHTTSMNELLAASPVFQAITRIHEKRILIAKIIDDVLIGTGVALFAALSKAYPETNFLDQAVAGIALTKIITYAAAYAVGDSQKRKQNLAELKFFRRVKNALIEKGGSTYERRIDFDLGRSPLTAITINCKDLDLSTQEGIDYARNLAMEVEGILGEFFGIRDISEIVVSFIITDNKIYTVPLNRIFTLRLTPKEQGWRIGSDSLEKVSQTFLPADDKTLLPRLAGRINFDLNPGVTTRDNGAVQHFQL